MGLTKLVALLAAIAAVSSQAGMYIDTIPDKINIKRIDTFSQLSQMGKVVFWEELMPDSVSSHICVL